MYQLPCLNFPQYEFTVKNDDTGNYFILDTIRNKFLKLTPEEWVRQHIITYLIKDKNYPKGLMSIEKGLNINSQQKRYDAVAYNRNAEPLMLIECKAPEVKISQQTLDQAVVYNNKLLAKYLLLTNGMKTFCLKSEQNNLVLYDSVPSFEDACAG